MQSYIYIEVGEDGIEPITEQIASKIKKIPPNLRGPIKGIIVGHTPSGLEAQLAGLLEELLLVEALPQNKNNTEVISKILFDVISENGPGVLFLGFTHQGMALGPALGWRLKVPVITSCVDLDWTDSHINARRAIIGGKILASISADAKHGAVISVQKGAWKDEVGKRQANADLPVRPIPWKDAWAADRVAVKGVIEEISDDDEDITKADILVSIGRGLGDPENIDLIKDLASRIGGVISCSRPVVDLGWLPASRQVGISGKTVMPVVYLALGISGQTNHVAGMDAAGLILAVNKDPLAPIFNVADYGIVDDIFEFVPELINQLKTKETPIP